MSHQLFDKDRPLETYLDECRRGFAERIRILHKEKIMASSLDELLEGHTIGPIGIDEASIDIQYDAAQIKYTNGDVADGIEVTVSMSVTGQPTLFRYRPRTISSQVVDERQVSGVISGTEITLVYRQAEAKAAKIQTDFESDMRSLRRNIERANVAIEEFNALQRATADALLGSKKKRFALGQEIVTNMRKTLATFDRPATETTAGSGGSGGVGYETTVSSSSSPAGSKRYERFAERARRSLAFAQEEAAELNHSYIGPEHILLGLIREAEGVAANVLLGLEVNLGKVRSRVTAIAGRGESAGTQIGLTPRAKKIVDLAVDDARRQGDDYIGTEHLLIGLMREGSSIPAGVLESMGVTLDGIYTELQRF